MSDLNSNLVLDYLNNKQPSPQVKKKEKWEGVFYETSLHTRGACPKFKDLTKDSVGYIIPHRYMGDKYQKLFDHHLMTRHPREPFETHQWRLSQYRPFTKTPFAMLTDVLKGAIFQDSQYTLQLPDIMDNDYIWGNNWQGKNLIQFFKDVILPSDLEDPNGVCVRLPSKPWYEQKGNKVEVDIRFINSKDVVFIGPKDFVWKGIDDLTSAEYAFWVNDLTIFRYVKFEGNFQVEERGYYAHMLGWLPANVAGGIWNTDSYYDSFYDKAIAWANEHISSFSAEQMVDKEASHPYIVQVAETCPKCQGTALEMLPDMQGDMKKVACTKCNGTGTMSISPASRLTVDMEDWEKGKGEFLKIITPDISVNKYHRDKNVAMFEMILRALNLLNIDAAQSGKAKAIDQEKLHLFTSDVNNSLFDNMIGPSVRDIVAFRNVVATPTGVVPHVYEYVLIKPTQFQIKTSSDLMLEMTEGTKANIPGYIRKKIVKEYVDKRFSGDDIFQKKDEVIAELDDLYVYSQEELGAMKLNGNIEPKDLIFSRKLPGILDEIIRSKGTSWFKSSDISTIKTVVDAEMKSFLSVGFVLIDDNGNPQDDVKT